MFIYSYTALVIYSCAGYALALLIAVDVPYRSTRLCRPDVLSLTFLIAVEIHLIIYIFSFADRG